MIVALLIGCTDAVTVPRNTCGNGVVEPSRGEDCDSDDAAGGCSGCRLVCATAEECPTGVCGPDNLCHTSSGRFVPRDVAASLSVTSFVVQDVDRDQIGDVVGTGNGSVSTLLGDATFPLELGETKDAPFATAAPTIRDINNDGYPDILIPAQAGIATFETGATQASPLEPVAFPFEVANSQTFHLRAGEVPISTGPASGGVIHLTRTPNEYRLISAEHTPAIDKRACNIGVGMNDSIVGRTLEPLPFGNKLLVALVVSHGATSELCVDSITDAGTNPAINVANPPQLGNVVLGEFDGQLNCPDVAVPKQTIGGPVAVVYRGSASAPCSITSVMLADVPGAPLARIKIGTGSMDHLITSAGVFFATSPMTPVLTATRSWTTAVTRDFDRNAMTDFAVAGTSEDVEVFQQRTGSTWRILRIPTPTTILDLSAGDFDGDGFVDLAMAAADAGGNGNLYLSYGSPSTFTDVTLALDVREKLIDLSSAALDDDSVQMGTDVYEDIVITHGVTPSKLSFLYGSANRQVGAPWRPRDTTEQNTAEGVVVGRFGPNGAPGVIALFRDPYKDLTPAFAPPMPDQCGMLGRQLYRSPSTFEFMRFVSTCDAKAFTSNSRFISIPRGAKDLVIGLNLTADPGTNGSTTIDCAAYLWAGPETPNLALAKVACSDLVEDDTLELTVRSVADARMVPDREQTITVTSRVRDNSGQIESVMHEWFVDAADGARPKFVDPVAIDAIVKQAVDGATHVSCFDVAYVDLGVRTRSGVTFGGGLDQVFACHIKSGGKDVIQLVARFRDDKSRTEPGVIEVFEELGNQDSVDIEAGDVTGDGLADIVIRTDRGKVRILENCDLVCAAKDGAP